MFYHSVLLRKIYFCLNYFCATSSWSISKQSNVKSSFWSVWLLYYRLLSSRRYRIWAPSSSELNTTTNICHALFAFASSPLGKTHMQWPAQFWSGFFVWDWFDLFFKKDAFFWISARKSKMVETHVALGVACRNVCRGPYVHGGGVDLSDWSDCWPYWDYFFLWERSRDGLSWKPGVGVLIARSQQVQLAGVQPQARGCPSGQSSVPSL